MVRKTVSTRFIMCIPWGQIDDEAVEWDLVKGIHLVTRDYHGHILERLKNGTLLTLVSVSPKNIRPSLRDVSRDVVAQYERDWKQGVVFPPVIIDSSKKEALLEGRHRTLSAVRVGIPEIEAFDLAGIRLSKIDGTPLIKYEFPECMKSARKS